jgi:acyl-CoA dehydrogenase
MSATRPELLSLRPLNLFSATPQPGSGVYRRIGSIHELLNFFESKGLAALKVEDREERWYDDWLEHNSRHGIYASLLSPAAYSSRGAYFDLLNLVRFVEAFGSCSPAHGYSFQVSFLGLFPILMSSNEALKKEAIAALENGALFAFGVSEKTHGSDLYSNEFEIRTSADGGYIANGKKYYIGNANCAWVLSTLGRLADKGTDTPKTGTSKTATSKKDAFMFFALRREGLSQVKKIPTLGVRSAFVGEFEAKDWAFTERDVISQGTQAWDSVFGTVNLGKFLLGFGSVGICERAMAEALEHARKRILFGRAVSEMPHIRSTLVQAYVRLCAMKLYAYRAADYLQMSSPKDRRYLLFNSVQKARVSTEGVRVMELLSECVGARGFESETYFESALRDALLIPGLEGSTHINYGLTARLLKNYFFGNDASLVEVPSMALSEAPIPENPELMRAQAGSFKEIRFGNYRKAYDAFDLVPNVGIFASQVKALRNFASGLWIFPQLQKDADFAMMLGKIFSIAVYGQLIAENAQLAQSDPALVSLIFQQLIEDLSVQALKARSLPQLPRALGFLLGRCIRTPQSTKEEIDGVAALMKSDFS